MWFVYRLLSSVRGVKDPQALHSVPDSVFERYAIKAIMGFRYSPRIVDGISVENKGEQHRFEFSEKLNHRIKGGL